MTTKKAILLFQYGFLFVTFYSLILMKEII